MSNSRKVLNIFNTVCLKKRVKMRHNKHLQKICIFIFSRYEKPLLLRIKEIEPYDM